MNDYTLCGKRIDLLRCATIAAAIAATVALMILILGLASLVGVALWWLMTH